MTSWWCEYAAIDGAVHAGVTITAHDGRFSAIDTDTAPPADAARLDGLTIPGLANTHSHAFHRVLRSRTQADRGSFWTWRKEMYKAAARLDPDNYYRLARAVFAEMVLAGQTAVGEFHYVHHQPDGTPYDDQNQMGHALLAAADDAGIRITLLDTLYLHGGLDADGYRPVDGPQHRYADADAERWAQRIDNLVPGANQLIGGAVHSIRAVDPDSIAVAAESTRNVGAPLHAHVSEQRAENDACLDYHGGTPLATLHRSGALGPTFTAVHATHLHADDMRCLASSGATVSMCPTTERDLGDGIGPTVELTEAGIPIHLGSDSHANIDHFVEARSIELHERLRSERRGLHTAPDLLAMATVNGHRALGWTSAGRLAIGHRADLVAIRLDSERTAGISGELAIEAAIFAATTADISTVVVDGETVVADHRHLRIDVRAELHASIEELVT